MLKRTLGAAAALLLAGSLSAAPLALPTGTYKVDPVHSELGFDVPHLVISVVHGKFDDFQGTVKVRSGRRISVEGVAKAASVDTGNEMRDSHLRGTNPNRPKDDFFYAEKYPTLSFRSTKTELKDDGSLSVTGELTIRGVTKTVTFTGQYRGSVTVAAMGGTRIAAHLETTINRQDYGLKFNAVLDAGPVVGDQVHLVLDIEAVKQS